MVVKRLLRAAPAVLAAVAIALAQPAAAPGDGVRTIATAHSFGTLWNKLKAAVKANGMGVVAQACASCGAKGRGLTIPGNAVVMVFRNDHAVRMLAASVAAGIEAPLRFYLTEGADGTATLTYRTPSATFAPYGSADLDAMSRELDAIWDKIVSDTLN